MPNARRLQTVPSTAFSAVTLGGGNPLWTYRSQIVNIPLADAAARGDYDGNGIVDEGDHLVWRSTFGSTTQLDADGNGNGTVDAADYTVWRDHFTSASSGSASHNQATPATDATPWVPEGDLQPTEPTVTHLPAPASIRSIDLAIELTFAEAHPVDQRMMPQLIDAVVRQRSFQGITGHVDTESSDAMPNTPSSEKECQQNLENLYQKNRPLELPPVFPIHEL